jgi:hypothetical protein
VTPAHTRAALAPLTGLEANGATSHLSGLACDHYGAEIGLQSRKRDCVFGAQDRPLRHGRPDERSVPGELSDLTDAAVAPQFDAGARASRPVQ